MRTPEYQMSHARTKAIVASRSAGARDVWSAADSCAATRCVHGLRPRRNLTTATAATADGMPQSGAVDFEQLAVRPLDGFLRRHALHGLGVHIDDNVLGHDLGCLAGGGPLVAGKAPRARRLLVG